MVMHEPRNPELQLYSHVYTYDGKRLGTVRDTTRGYFKVQVRWGRDYWLNSALVRECSPHRVLLHVSHDALDSYKTYDLDADFSGHVRVSDQAAPRHDSAVKSVRERSQDQGGGRHG